MSNDPYAAPTANLENFDDAPTIPTKPLSAKGRLSVLSYLGQSLILMLIATVVIGALAAIGYLVAGVSPDNLESLNMSNPILIVLMVLAAIFYIFVIYVTVCMMIKRLHDRNHSGWWSLGLFVGSLIPFVNIVAILGFLYVIFFPGQKTANRFGGRRQTKGWEKVLGIIYIVLMIGGIVAMIAGGAAFISQMS